MITKTVLDNGIRVITERIPSLHSVALGLWVQHGSRHEPLSLNGSSHFIEHMLFKGTSTRDSREIAAVIDAAGGLLNAFTSREYSCYYAKVLGEALPTALELLSDLVLDSVFAPEEVEKERRVILQEISMVDDAPEDQVHESLCSGVWPGHAIGRPVLGTPESVSSFRRDQLIGSLRDNYCGERLLVCAAGDVEHARMVELAQTALGDLPAGSASPPQDPPRFHAGIDVKTRELEQVHLCLAMPSLSQADPQRFPLYLFNTLLGSSMSSRLFQKVREEHGLAYSIYSYLNAFSDCGAQVIYAGIAPGDVQQTLDLILRELRDLATRPVRADELSAARNQLKGNLLLSLENTDNRMSRLAKDEIYFGASIPVAEVVAAIDAVTPEQIVATSAALLQGDRFHLQMIGSVREKDIGQVDLCLGMPSPREVS